MKKALYKKGIRIAALLTAFLFAAGCVTQMPSPSSSSASSSKPAGQTSKAERSSAPEEESRAVSPELSDSETSPFPEKSDITFYHSELQVTDDVLPDLNKVGLEITLSRFTYYDDTDWWGPTYDLVFEYKNTGTQALLPSFGVKLYDGNDQEIETYVFVETVHGIIAPGETDYAYAHGYLDTKDANNVYVDMDIDLSKGLTPKITFSIIQEIQLPQYTFYQFDTDIKMEITEKGEWMQEGQIRFSGTITNPTDEKFSQITMHYLLFDANDKILAITPVKVSLFQPKQTVEVHPTLVLNSEITPEMVAYCIVEARTWKYTGGI